MRRLVVGLMIALALCPAGRAQAAPFTKVDTNVVMSDGVRIGVSYFEPAGTPPAAGWPAVVLLHGIGLTRNRADFLHWTPNFLASQYLAPEGYAVLTYDARAHGESGGLFTLDGPRELADFRELLTWLTTRHPVDARHVGAYGASYGGGLVWKAAVEGFPLAAIVPVATWTDLQEALAPQDLLRAGIVLGFAQAIPRERFGAEEAALLADAIAQRNISALRAYAASRSTRRQLGNVRVPTFMLQGRRDFAFDARQALAAFSRLRGPKRLYLGNLGHTPAANPPAEFDYAARQARDWFDRFLKNVPNGIDTRPPIELAPDPWAPPRSFRTLPKSKRLTFRFNRRRTLTADGKVVYTTKPIRKIETFGTPVVKVSMSTVTGYKHLVAVLTALTPDGREIVVSEGGSDTQAVKRKARAVTIRLQNEITSIPARSRLRLTFGARSTVQSLSNLVYLIPVADGARAVVGRARLTLPVLAQAISP